VKAETINQFKLIKHVEDNFIMDNIKIELVDENSIRISDGTGDYCTFVMSSDGIHEEYFREKTKTRHDFDR